MAVRLWPTTVRSLSLGLAVAAMTAQAYAADWTIEKVTTNLEVVSLSEAELSERQIKPIALGELELPTGRIVTTDPLVQPQAPALARSVKPGRYTVTLYDAEDRASKSNRIALAALRFAEGTPVKWEIATWPGQNAADLKAGEIFGYGVDAGLGCYMDAAAFPLIEAREKLVRQEKDTDDINYYDDVLAEELGRNGDKYVLHQPMKDSPVNVAVFESGWGDGFYPSFWGLDAAGEPLVLVTEFYVLENAGGRAKAN